MSDPLAYHITWTTYGTWLSGDSRGWVKGGEAGIREPDSAIEAEMKARMTDEPVRLSGEQREVVEETIRGVVSHRGWSDAA